MFQIFRVPIDERAVVFRDGLPVRALAPGRHRLWGSGFRLERFKTGALVFDAPPEVRAVLPEDWFAEVRIGSRQRAVLYQNGVPRLFVRPGTRWYWTVDASVELSLLSVDQPPPALTEAVLSVIPHDQLVRVIIAQHQRGLLYVEGRFERVLEPGRHAHWNHPEAPVSIQVVDMRRQQLVVQGQELMTRDKVTLRLTLAVEWSPLDPAEATHVAANARDALYTQVQLAVRDFVAGVTLDELLEGRDEMTRYLTERVVPEAARFGVRVEGVGVRDILLPGDMKTLFNRVIEAEKEAAANVILRREEAAATRTMANAAQLMADRPMLLRLKEIEALKDIAGRVGEVRVVIGKDGLEKLLGSRNGDAQHD